MSQPVLQPEIVNVVFSCSLHQFALVSWIIKIDRLDLLARSSYFLSTAADKLILSCSAANTSCCKAALGSSIMDLRQQYWLKGENLSFAWVTLQALLRNCKMREQEISGVPMLPSELAQKEVNHIWLLTSNCGRQDSNWVCWFIWNLDLLFFTFVYFCTSYCVTILINWGTSRWTYAGEEHLSRKKDTAGCSRWRF